MSLYTTSPATYVFVVWILGFVLVGWGVLAPQRQGRFSAAIAKDTRARRTPQRAQVAVARAVELEATRTVEVRPPIVVRAATVAEPIAEPVPVEAHVARADLPTPPVPVTANAFAPPAALPDPPVLPPPADVLPIFASPTDPVESPTDPSAEPMAEATAPPAVETEPAADLDDLPNPSAEEEAQPEPAAPAPSKWARFAFWKRRDRLVESSHDPDVQTPPVAAAMGQNDEEVLAAAAAPSVPVPEPADSGAAASPIAMTWTDLVLADGASVEADERRAMLDTLGAIAEEWCGPIVARALAEEFEPALREAALLAARDGRLAATHDVVIALLASAREQERLLSVEVLGALGDRDAVTGALGDEAIAVATVAAYELGKMIATEERDALVYAKATAHAEAILELLGALA